MAPSRWSFVLADALVGLLLVALLLLTHSLGADWFHRPLGTLKEPRVLVEKSRGVLSVRDGSRLVKKYRVITGLARGDKEKEGDKRTPEGDFCVCYLNPQSKYTLSMGLSYPDIEHARRGLRRGLITHEQFNAIVQAINGGGQPPWDTPLGGEIMIHGAGINRPGTLGCIGMADDDIRELYPALPIGTPVKIAP